MIFVGIDVACDKHNCCIINRQEKVLSEFEFANSICGFDFLLSEIRKYSDDDKINIGLEATGIYGDNLVAFLHKNNLETITINPLVVKKFLSASSLRKTKTDKSDARFLAHLVIQEFSEPDTPISYHISELKSLTRFRNQAVIDRSRFKIRAKRLITMLFPEFKTLFTNCFSASAIAVLKKYPSAQHLAKARISTLNNILYEASRGRYNYDTAIHIKNIATHSVGQFSAAKVSDLIFCISQIEIFNDYIKSIESQIKEIMDKIDSPITSFVGIGYVLGATILAEIGDISRFSSSNKLQAFAGLEPSIYQSGKFTPSSGSMVKHGSPYLRNALILASRIIVRFDDTFSNYFNKKINEGKHYNVAISHVAKKLVRIIFHLLSKNIDFHKNFA